MSYRKVIGVAGLLALGCALLGYYWVRERNAELARAWASARASDSGSAPSTDLPAVAPSSTTPAGTSDKNAEPARDPGLPLRRGEVLEYTANVSSLTNVANLKLQVGEHKDFFGKNAWHLQAFAHTESPLRMVFELDDRFDSYSDAATMTSLQYEMHLSERGQKVDSVQRMTATGKEPAPPDSTETRVLPGTRDPLGMMQFLRNVDWTGTAEVRSPVYDGHKLYDVRAKLCIGDCPRESLRGPLHRGLVPFDGEPLAIALPAPQMREQTVRQRYWGLTFLGLPLAFGPSVEHAAI